MVSQLKSVAKHPSLDLIEVASPCTADWNAMQGEERKRFCSQCNLNVFNLSEMTREEAFAFVAKSEGRTCIRMYKRADGTLITRDCPVGLAAVRAKFVRLVAASVGLSVALFASLLTAAGAIPGIRAFTAQSKVCRLKSHNMPVTGKMVMGNVAPPVMGVMPAGAVMAQGGMQPPPLPPAPIAPAK
ncbi:hypothetical protein ETAA8_58530 [Anatilimnocola aggregata]|uniref:Uncharacterized protein n=1 Tax=Anatilimnocola aggregata TaxID=2528021 RepID=A0A517YKF3_9BACT|nr:hypothetical protein [Anatilimnocola aggregata]QDU30705.1 hypothetical protein ETAA8_58530 [Anatilimnocola aggregata]